MSCPDTYPDIISVRSFISKQFPTLLAIREIIADAMINQQKSYRHPALRESALAYTVYGVSAILDCKSTNLICK